MSVFAGPTGLEGYEAVRTSLETCGRQAHANGSRGILAPGGYLVIRANARSISAVSKLFVVEAGYTLVDTIRDKREVKCGLVLKAPQVTGKLSQWEAYQTYDATGTTEGDLEPLMTSIMHDTPDTTGNGLKKEVERSLGRSLAVHEKQALRSWYKRKQADAGFTLDGRAWRSEGRAT